MGDHAAISRSLVAALRDRFARRWRLELDGSTLLMQPRIPLPRSTKRCVPAPAEVVHGMAQALADGDLPRPSLLPIRWGRDTDLLISAVQGLDPWLKDGLDRVWREGFLPQPVVRFTGERDAHGRLREGFLTAFVNVSYVRRITGVEQHCQLIDTWLDGLSDLGIHAGRLRLVGDLTVWQRATVCGITLHLSCDGIGFADAVLLWHSGHPNRLATDLGSGLERLRWLLSPRSWAETTFGADAKQVDIDVLDAVRTATLLTMAGLRPGDHGADGAVRRVTRRIPAALATTGLGRLIRTQRLYWCEVGMTGPPWPQIAQIIEADVLRQAAGHRT